MSQPLSRTRINKIRHWLHADPPFIWGDHTRLGRVKFWISRFVRFCWRWRDISPGPLFIAVAWLWGHSPYRLLPFPRLPLWGLTLVGAGITVWSIHFDSNKGRTANKERAAHKLHRYWSKVCIDVGFDEIPSWRRDPTVRDHATTIHVDLLEGMDERRFYLAATRKLRTIFKKPVRFRDTGHGGADIVIQHRDPLKDEPPLPTYLGNEDGPDLEPTWDHMPWGINDDDETFDVHLHQNHILVNGQTGSGKSSSCVAFAVACIAARHVSPVAMEPSRKSFACLRTSLDYVAGPEACLDQLREEHRQMEKRHAVMDELDTSLLMPSLRTPLRVIFIDEMQNLLDPHLHGDKFVEEFRKPLADILDRGRAVGYSVVGICTNPRKTILTEGLRDQFTYRLVFKVADRTAAGLGLGTVPKYYEPDLLPMVPGRCVMKTDDYYQLRTYRTWDAQARNAAVSLTSQPDAACAPAGAAPAEPQVPLTNGGLSDSSADLSPRRRHRRGRDQTRAEIVDHLQRHPQQQIKEIAASLGLAQSVVRYWLTSPECKNLIPVKKVGYRYELVS